MVMGWCFYAALHEIKVTVSIEYKKDPPVDSKGPQEERKFGTVIVDSKKSNFNLAVELMSRGLAECVRHRNEDERSRHYDALLAGLTVLLNFILF
jgi:hypothetical protein